VKEEKLLLMAKESQNQSDILVAIKQIINNCILDTKIDINRLALYDIEYVFLKLRAVSVDNIVKVAYKDTEDNKIYEFEIDLNEIQIISPENASNNIKITENAGIIMRYPPASLYDDEEFLKLDKDYMFELIVRCVDKVYLGEEVYDAKQYKKKQLDDFLDNLDIKTFENISSLDARTQSALQLQIAKHLAVLKAATDKYKVDISGVELATNTLTNGLTPEEALIQLTSQINLNN
jgi:hypothetical protein